MNGMESNNDQQFNKDDLTLSISKRSYRIWIYPLILLIVLAGLGYWFYQYSSQKAQDLDLSPSEVSKLQDSDKDRVLKAQLKDLENRASQLNEQSTKSDRFVVYIQLAEVQTALGKNEEAIASLDKIQSENLGNTRLWMTYAQIFQNMNNLGGAKASVQKAMEIDDGIADNWLFLIEISKNSSREDQDKLYKEALIKTENDPKITAAYQAWQNFQ